MGKEKNITAEEIKSVKDKKNKAVDSNQTVKK